MSTPNSTIARLPALEWFASSTGTAHAFDPGAPWSTCRMIMRPDPGAPVPTRTCRVCEGMLAGAPATFRPWAETWERARRSESCRRAMDTVLDVLVRALRCGNEAAVQSARQTIRLVERQVASRVG